MSSTTKPTKPPITVSDVATKLSKGVKLSQAEQKFYESNADSIETELKGISANDRSNISGNDQQPSATPVTTYNPLENQIENKAYVTDQPGGAQPNTVIPEHTYTAPPEEIYIPEANKTKDQKDAEKREAEKEKEPANKDFKGASDDEKTRGAEQLADVIFTTMSQLYQGANNLIKISEKKLNKLQQSGEINTNVVVPYKTGYDKLSIVLKDYNNDASNLLTVEEEWKEQVRPPLVEELAKAGHGMSNKQFLIYMFATKLATDSYKAFQFLSLKSDYLKFAREQTILDRRKRRNPSQGQPVVTEPIIEHEDEVIEDGEVVDNTLQAQAIAKLAPAGVNNKLNLGNRDKLDSMEKAAKRNNTDNKRIARETISSARRTVQQRASADPVPGTQVKRKPGRPPGSLNKPKTGAARRRR